MPNPNGNFPDNDNIPLQAVLRGRDANRWDEMARDREPWGEEEGQSGPDTRTTQDLWEGFMLRYANRDVQTFEGNQRAEQGKVPFGGG